MPQKTLEFKADRLDLGLNLQSERNLKMGEISSGSSARFERGSGIFTGPGYFIQKDLGTNESVDGMFEARVFGIIFAKSNTQVFYSQNPSQADEWYDLNLSSMTGALTTITKTDFVKQGNGDVFIVNIDDPAVRLAIAPATAQIADSATTITVGAGQINKYSTSGTGTVNGDVFTWTGKNATQLTGVTGISGAKAVNSLVIEATEPSTFGEKPAFAFEFQSRMVIGGEKDLENILRASAPETLANPEFFYDFDANGTVTKAFDEKLVGGINGIGRAFVFGEKVVHQLIDFDITTGAFLSQPISKNYGAYNSRCIVDMDGVIAFFGNKRLIPITIQLSPEGTDAPFLGEDFDHRLRPWLDELDDGADQEDAHLHYNTTTKILKISARRNGALETYVYDRQNDAFLPSESRPGFAFTNFDGNAYFGDTVGRVFRDDFGSTNNGFAILHNWSTGRMEFDKGRTAMQLWKLEYEGFLSEAGEHTLRIYLDGSSQAANEWQFDDSIITSTNGQPLGEQNIGVSPLGDDEALSFVFPYQVHVILRGLSAKDVKLEWECSKEGMFFQVNSFKMDTYGIRRSQDTFI